jgi:replicative DNA helicase
LIIIGGQTGHGKSMLMQRIALNVALKNKPVLYLSLEMSIPQQISRFYSMAKNEIKDTVEVISDLPIYFYGGKDTMTLPLLNRLLRVAKERYGIVEVFIDHIHYFSQDIDNVTSELGLIVRTLKEYSRRYEIPIVAISTLRKLNKKGMPDIDDLKDSVMIGYDADIIMMIYRDVEGKNKPANELVVKVRKNRPRGKVGSIVLEITDNYNLVSPAIKTSLPATEAYWNKD